MQSTNNTDKKEAAAADKKEADKETKGKEKTEEEKAAEKKRREEDEQWRKRNQEFYLAEKNWPQIVMVSDADEQRRVDEVEKEAKIKAGMDPNEPWPFALGNGNDFGADRAFLPDGIYKEKPPQPGTLYHFKIEGGSIKLLPPPKTPVAREPFAKLLGLTRRQGYIGFSYSPDVSADAISRMRPTELAIHVGQLRLLMQEAEKQNMTITWEETYIDKEGNKQLTPMGMLLDKISPEERQQLLNYRDYLAQNQSRNELLNETKVSFKEATKALVSEKEKNISNEDYLKNLETKITKDEEGKEKVIDKDDKELMKSVAEETKKLKNYLEESEKAISKIDKYFGIQDKAIEYKELPPEISAAINQNLDVAMAASLKGKTHVKHQTKLFTDKDKDAVRGTLVENAEKQHIETQQERYNVYEQLKQQHADAERKLELLANIAETKKDIAIYDTSGGKTTTLALRLEELEKEIKKQSNMIDIMKADSKTTPDALKKSTDAKQKLVDEQMQLKEIEELSKISEKGKEITKLETEVKDLQAIRDKQVPADQVNAHQNEMTGKLTDHMVQLDGKIKKLDDELRSIDEKLATDIFKGDKGLLDKKERISKAKDEITEKIGKINEAITSTENKADKIKGKFAEVVADKETELTSKQSENKSRMHQQLDRISKNIDPNNPTGLIKQDVKRAEDLRARKNELQQQQKRAPR